MATKDKSLLLPLDSNPVQCVLTNRLQVADLIEHVIKWLGTVDLWQTTFSVSEEFLRRMYFLGVKDGLIRSAQVILDYKGAQKTVKLWRFIDNVFSKAYMADNHSKIILARQASGDDQKVVSIITSQNLTRGNRFESSIITTDQAVFDSLLQDWNEIASKNSVPLNELLSSTDSGDSELCVGLHPDL